MFGLDSIADPLFTNNPNHRVRQVCLSIDAHHGSATDEDSHASPIFVDILVDFNVTNLTG